MPHTASARLTPTTVALLVIPPLMWAGNAVVGRMMQGVLPPITFNLLRWSLALLILLPVAGWVLRPGSPLWPHWRRFALLGLLGVGTEGQAADDGGRKYGLAGVHDVSPHHTKFRRVGAWLLLSYDLAAAGGSGVPGTACCVFRVPRRSFQATARSSAPQAQRDCWPRYQLAAPMTPNWPCSTTFTGIRCSASLIGPLLR